MPRPRHPPCHAYIGFYYLHRKLLFTQTLNTTSSAPSIAGNRDLASAVSPFENGQVAAKLYSSKVWHRKLTVVKYRHIEVVKL